MPISVYGHVEILQTDAHFDLILLDIIMPEINGYEVCDALKKNPQTQDIPIIFITAKSDSEDVIKGFSLGGVDYITKPFHPLEVLARVSIHLRLSIATIFFLRQVLDHRLFS